MVLFGLCINCNCTALGTRGGVDNVNFCSCVLYIILTCDKTGECLLERSVSIILIHFSGLCDCG